MSIATVRPVLTLLLATGLGVLQPVAALAWLYPEHRDITPPPKLDLRVFTHPAFHH